MKSVLISFYSLFLKKSIKLCKCRLSIFTTYCSIKPFLISFTENSSQQSNLRTIKNTVALTYQNRSFRDALTNGKLKGICVLNAKRTILKKKLMFYSLLISVWVNTASVFILLDTPYIHSVMNTHD